MKAIDTQLFDPINSGLARWHMAVVSKYMAAAAELVRNPASKHQIQPDCGVEQADAGRDSGPVSRDQILRRERGQGNINFRCSTDHEQGWQPYPVDPYYSCYMCDHIYIRVVCYRYDNRFCGQQSLRWLKLVCT